MSTSPSIPLSVLVTPSADSPLTLAPGSLGSGATLLQSEDALSPCASGLPQDPQDGSFVATVNPSDLSSQPQISVKSSIPATVPAIDAPSYAQRFKSSLRNLRKISSPTYLEDGVPVVQAPESVLLKTAAMWKDHLVAQFHGLIPPPAKIYSDLNPAWGKHGNITIRTVSDTSCLILIPCVSTRNWVLQVGYWQAGNCAFSVFPWSPDGSLEPLELATAPTWAVLKNVPPQMYSLDGISVITSAIGEPLHTEKSRLDPYHFGDTKVKVEICLESSPPSTIIVRDSQGNSVRVEVSYPRLPPKCCNCGRFGHLLNRCPKPLLKKAFGKGGADPFVAGGEAVADTKVSLAPRKVEEISAAMVAAVKRLPQIPVSTELVSVKVAPVTTRSRSRSRDKGRGRSAPRVVVSDPVGLRVAKEEKDKGMVPPVVALAIESVSKKSSCATVNTVDDGFTVVRRKNNLPLKAAGSLTKQILAKGPGKNSRNYYKPVKVSDVVATSKSLPRSAQCSSAIQVKVLGSDLNL